MAERTDVEGIAALAEEAAVASGRSDLADRVRAARDRIADHETVVLVAGSFKQGKSALVNALTGLVVCAVDDDVPTQVPLTLRWGEEWAAEAVSGDARVPVSVADVDAWVTGAATAPGGAPVDVVHVAAPAPLLRHGLRLVDTAPAVAVLSSGALSTVHALAFADAVLFVTDASQELTRAEVDFLALAARMCPTVRCVLTKVDLYPDWRRIRELDASHLRAAGLADTVMPVSAALHGAGAVDESGVPAVASWLANELAGSARQGEIALAAEAARVADQLAVQFEAERSVLSDPGAAASLLEALDAARARSESLRATGARWQVALDDGFNDLFAEVDRDLRARLLEVERWADEAVEGLDPARGCDELERSVRQMMATGVAASYALLHDRAGALVARVAELVDAEVAAVAAPGGEVPTPAVQGGFGAVVRRPSWISLGVTALRGTSEGVVIAGMFGALAGVVLAMPLMMVAGVVIGARGVHDENERLLAERREKTKAAVHRYLEEVTVNVANDAPASLRHLQRELRDELQSRAEAAHRSASEAVAAAGAAAAAAASARKRRLAAVEAELARVEGLRRRAEQLVPA